MLLKRVADKTGPEPPRNLRDGAGGLVDPELPEGAYLEPWPLDHVRVLSTGATPLQHFSPRFVLGAAGEGWLRLERDRIVLDVRDPAGEPVGLVYRILASPGVFCCHCGKRLGAGDQVARAHLEQLHAGEASPDPQNPAGYRVDNFYRCELES